MSGYDENYRYQIIKSGVEGFDKMLQREANEGVPINKPRAYKEDQRQRKKGFQKKCWFKKGGYDVPLFVPHSPGGELAKRMRMKEAQNNQYRRIRARL